MAFNPVAGVNGSVKIGGTSYAFGKWSLSMKSNLMPVNNFTGTSLGVGYQQIVAGVVSADLTLEALTYDQGNMAFSVGTRYAFTLGYNATTNIAIGIYIETIEPTVDFDGLEAIKISGKSDGAFVASIS